MRNNKFIIGITGGSGAGKTTVSDVFRKNGIPVIDADIVAREIVEKGRPALAQIAEEFDGVILPDGTLNRKKLGAIVFSDGERLKTLNKITHKYITERIYELIDGSAGEYCAVDGAALFESGIDRECDCLCAVVADNDVRVRRIAERDGITPKQAQTRIDAQMSDREYAERCGFVINNSGCFSKTENEVRAVIDKIKEHR